MIAFLAAALPVLALPGTGNGFVVLTGISAGRRAGWRAALGIAASTLVHAGAVAAAGVLLGPLDGPAPWLRWVGFGILAALGAREVRHALGSGRPRPGPPARRARRRPFLEAFLINGLNPQSLLFLAAVLPAFVGAEGTGATLFLLGASFAALGLAVDSAYLLAATRLGELVGSRWGRRSPWPGILLGCLYVALAFWILLAS